MAIVLGGNFIAAACSGPDISRTKSMNASNTPPPIVERDEFQAVEDHSRSYANWSDKGAVAGGRRLTLLVARQHVRVGEEVRVIHVAEAVDASATVYTMGPKAIEGEFLDGKVEHTARAGARDDPLTPPGLYDGPVVRGPAVDFGFETSSYRFDVPGNHRIQWRLGNLVSNELNIVVE